MHAETWLVLFDLYRATGQQDRFESLALDYARQFGWSAPQWFSLPKMVSDAVSEERPICGRDAAASAQIGRSRRSAVTSWRSGSVPASPSILDNAPTGSTP